MYLRLRRALLVSVLISVPVQGGFASDDRAVSGELSTGLAIDAGLWLTVYAMETYWRQPTGLRTFPTDGFDRSARDIIHGTQLDEECNPREMLWRRYSDYGVAGLVAGSIAVPLASSSEQIQKLGAVSRAFAVNNLATTFLKHAVHRSRPKPTLSNAVPQDGDHAKSFPSGHSSNAMVAATSIVLMTPGKPLAFHAAIYGLGASIGMARIMADRHFLTDVLAGAAIGVGITHVVFWEQQSLGTMSAGVNSIGYILKF